MQKDSLLIGKRMRTISFFIVLINLISCAEKVIEPPENLIAKDKMVDILYDLALLNSAKSTNPLALEEKQVEAMPFLFEKYNIDSLQFAQSDLYYASIPLEYEDIYMKIKARLEGKVNELDEARKQRSESAREKADKRKDSLKKVTGEVKKPALSRK